VAAPTFARLGARIMAHMGVERIDGTRPTPDPIALMMDNPDFVDGFDALTDVEPALPGHRPVSVDGGLPDFTGLTMTEALDAAQAADVKLVAVGSGVAVMQDHAPGPIENGTRVTVYFEPPA
jgi:cell division protein FtsI (penicillin-binding protein 3)